MKRDPTFIEKKKQCTKKFESLCLETIELSCLIKKMVLFYAVSNLNQRFNFALRSLLFLQSAKVGSFSSRRDNKTVNRDGKRRR